MTKGRRDGKEILRNRKRMNTQDVEVDFFLCFLHNSIVGVLMVQYVYVCAQDICRLESRALHIPTRPVLTALRNGMGKLSA